MTKSEYLLKFLFGSAAESVRENLVQMCDDRTRLAPGIPSDQQIASADALNPLDLKEPDVRVVPDWRVHVALETSTRQKRVKLELWCLNVYSTLTGPVRYWCLL